MHTGQPAPCTRKLVIDTVVHTLGVPEESVTEDTHLGNHTDDVVVHLLRAGIIRKPVIPCRSWTVRRVLNAADA